MLDVARRKTTGTWGGRRPGAGPKRQVPDGVDRTVRFPRDEVDQLEALAEQRDVSFATVVREAVAEYVTRRRK
jgi:hypothetical protein